MYKRPETLNPVLASIDLNIEVYIGFRVEDSQNRRPRLGFWGSGFGVLGAECRVWGPTEVTLQDRVGSSIVSKSHAVSQVQS